MEKNKKAWLKVVESVISLLMLIGIMALLSSRIVPEQDTGAYLSSIAYSLLYKLVPTNTTLVSDLIDCANTGEFFISDCNALQFLFDQTKEELAFMPQLAYNFSLSISEIVYKPELPEGKEIYSENIVINPKSRIVVYMYIWINK